MDSIVQEFFHPLTCFYKDSKDLLRRCYKPDRNGSFRFIAKSLITLFNIIL
jgi:preprotein translocase subunit Sss1